MAALARVFAGDASGVVATNTYVRVRAGPAGPADKHQRSPRARCRRLYAAACLPGALSTMVKESALAKQVCGMFVSLLWMSCCQACCLCVLCVFYV